MVFTVYTDVYLYGVIGILLYIVGIYKYVLRVYLLLCYRQVEIKMLLRQAEFTSGT